MSTSVIVKRCPLTLQFEQAEVKNRNFRSYVLRVQSANVPTERKRDIFGQL